MKKLCILILGIAMISCMSFALCEGTELFPDLEIFEPLDYIIGSDLESDEYILFALPGQIGSFHLATDIMYEEIIAEEEFETNVILFVEDDEYLIFENSIAVRLQDYYSSNRTIPTGRYGTMLVVGIDLEPGIYSFSEKPGKTGQCKVYLSSRHIEEDLAREYTGDELSNIELHSGEYVQLIDCCIQGGEEDVFTVIAPAPIQDDQPHEQAEEVVEEEVVEEVVEEDPALFDETDPLSEDDLDDDLEEVTDIIGYIVIRDGSNIRSLPTTKGEIIQKASSGEKYELLDDSDEKWYLIRLEDGTEGWILKSMAEPAD